MFSLGGQRPTRKTRETRRKTRRRQEDKKTRRETSQKQRPMARETRTQTRRGGHSGRKDWRQQARPDIEKGHSPSRKPVLEASAAARAATCKGAAPVFGDGLEALIINHRDPQCEEANERDTAQVE